MKTDEAQEKSSLGSQCRDAGMAYAFLAILVGLFAEVRVSFTIAGLILLITMSFPKALKYPSLFWFKFSEVLGGITSRILLSAIFFLIVSPIALVMRVFGKDQLQLRSHKQANSAFKDRSGVVEAQDLKDPF
jgi:hypothetical protein